MPNVLYYPPVRGKPGNNPADWPEGKLPISTMEAVSQARAANVDLYSSDDNYLIVRADNQPVNLPTTITIERGHPAVQWVQKNWYILAASAALIGLVYFVARRR